MGKVPTPASSVRMSWPRGSGWLVLALALLASGTLSARLAVRSLLGELATRPPVLILDAAGALRGLPATQVGPAIIRQRDMARRLADGGVLVLDPQAVVAAPAGLVLRTTPPPADSGVHP
jgi:hypothetical protein